MATTIQVSEKLVKQLKTRKLYDKETYEEVIWDLIEDTIELSTQTKMDIENAMSDFRKGKFYTHEEIKKELGL